MEPGTFFDRYAAAWDKTFARDTQKIWAMLALSEIAPHSVILDVGCGTGILEPYLLHYEPSVVLGVDLSSGMIQQAVAKIRHPAVRFLCADIFDVRNLCCDCCFVYNTLYHFADPAALIAHLAGLLRPGGRITVSHTQGLRQDAHGNYTNCRYPPAHTLSKLMSGHFHIDAVVDNNAMFLVSGIRL